MLNFFCNLLICMINTTILIGQGQELLSIESIYIFLSSHWFSQCCVMKCLQSQLPPYSSSETPTPPIHTSSSDDSGVISNQLQHLPGNTNIDFSESSSLFSFCSSIALAWSFMPPFPRKCESCLMENQGNKPKNE